MSDDANKTTATENGAESTPGENETRSEIGTQPSDPETGNAHARTTEATGSSTSLSPEQLQELKTKAARADENWDKLLRLSADFDNYKKRSVRERQDAIRFANESLLEKLVPVLDNFDMALAAATSPQAGNLDSLKTGITMIHSLLRNVLTESGLEEIDAANKPFDPAWHEAVSQQDSNDLPDGHVLQQLRKGYKLRERLLRPATVIVARKPSV